MLDDHHIHQLDKLQLVQYARSCSNCTEASVNELTLATSPKGVYDTVTEENYFGILDRPMAPNYIRGWAEGPLGGELYWARAEGPRGSELYWARAAGPQLYLAWAEGPYYICRGPKAHITIFGHGPQAHNYL